MIRPLRLAGRVWRVARGRRRQQSCARRRRRLASDVSSWSVSLAVHAGLVVLLGLLYFPLPSVIPDVAGVSTGRGRGGAAGDEPLDAV